MHKTRIQRSELDKMFHVTGDLGSRAVPLSPVLHPDGDWHIWVAVDGELQFVEGEPVEGEYWATKPEAEDDVYVPFLDFVHQHASWQGVNHEVDAIRNDIYNLAACWKKLETLHRAHVEWGTNVTRLVQTEIEYIFVVCRSIYDHLQKIITKLWDRIELYDDDLQATAKGGTFRTRSLRPFGTGNRSR